MAKKKRQGEPAKNGNSEGSSESSEEMRNSMFADCSHVNKAVDLNRVKKLLQRSAHLSAECELCKDVEVDVVGDDEVDNSLWMCLKCGHQACGRYRNSHAIQHFNVAHSDPHSICVNTTTWSVWCYHCDNEVNISGKKKLHECVEYIKKFAEGRTSNNSTATNHTDDMVETKILMPIFYDPNPTKYVARGLQNLGNTCFFNSVMQCLGQTPYLLKLLEETAIPGQEFKLPGGKLVLDSKHKISIDLDPLEGVLEEWKPLTQSLAETLGELQCGRRDTYNPHELFSCLSQRMTMFSGGAQHDSHELLRHLLDAVREEDLRRYQSVILKHLGFSTKTDPTTVEGEQRTIVRFYGGQAHELLLPTEQVFRGVLVSILKCQDCGHTSNREEYFLDLSLPILEKQRPPVQRRKADDSDDHRPSKHQIKKERRAMRKSQKRGHTGPSTEKSAVCSNNHSESTDDVPMEQEQEHSEGNEKSDSQSDADVEDNIEDSTNSRTPEEAPNKGTESGYNSDKNSPDNAFAEVVADETAASPAVGMLSASPFTPDSPVTSTASSDTNIDVGSPACGRISPMEDRNQEEFERPESRLAFVGNKSNDLKVDLEKLSIKNEKKPSLDGACGGAPPSDEDLAASEDEEMDLEEMDLFSGTISTSEIEDGECSVLSCFNQFTTSELMTANNKVRCELCTKRYGGPDKKPVNTNSTKQLLIYSPPAVLILHLKRFQLNKQVKFPPVLDIAPFCSKRARQLPTFHPEQTQVLYSLYGVVEHTGSLQGGHYIAYVKMRPKLTADHYRWQFLPKNQREVIEQTVDAAQKQSAGRWFYVSDSHAAEVTEARVLGASAYLLFYERIL